LDPDEDIFIVEDLPVSEEQPFVEILGEGGHSQDLVHPEKREVLPEPMEVQTRSLGVVDVQPVRKVPRFVFNFVKNY